MQPMSTVLIGDEALLAECGAQLLQAGHTIRAVATRNPHVASWAQNAGLRILQPGTDLATHLSAQSLDWLLNIAGLDRLDMELLALPRRGAVNFHDGPLPRYAGLNAPVWALIAGETQHGICWHRITEGIDEGPVLVRRAFDIAPDDTALTLNAKCFAAACESFAEVITAMALNANGQAQDLDQRTQCLRDDRPADAGFLDFTQPAETLARQVRALDHGPYWNPLTTAKLPLGPRIVCVSTASVSDAQGVPGDVLAVDADSITLACGTGALICTGLLCQQGLPIAPDTLVERGARLPRPDPALGAALARVVPAEAAMRAALRAMEPAPWHFGQPRATLALDTAGDSPAARILGFAHALATRTGLRRFDLRYVTPAMAAAPAILSGWVPLRIDLDAPNATQALERQLARAARAPGFALDLAARDPGLGPINAPPVAICADGAQVRASLVFDLDTDLLHHDPDSFPPADAQDFAALMRVALGRDDPAPLDTTRAYARDCIHHAFEAQVARTPDAIALSFEAEELSYAALNARANQLAHVLISMGVGPDMPVALCARRGPGLVVGALGILKAGGAYVPMDPDYPSDRLAHFLSDSGASVIVSERALRDSLPAHQGDIVLLDTDARLDQAPDTNPQTDVTADHLAYLIYTSGSTGRPKGVMVEHGNVANFFAGMDERIAHDTPGVWLALTSLSFDISVLELFWTLARGFKVVLQGDADRAMVAHGPVPVSDRKMDFSLMYWGNDDGPGPQKYRLLLEGAKFADTHGFCAIWTPERHFHAFGGPFPNPAVTGAAVAAVTKNLAVRAGSCVAPLHHPIRIAEDWAVIDNLTNGRTGLGIASGWHPVDFVIRPENRPPHNRRAMFDMIDTLRRLWRGEPVEFDKGDGMVPVQTLPRPVSKDLPLWLTVAGNPETWRDAGRIGANVLTHLLGQSIPEVAEKITLYHAALREAGHDPQDFTVTLMLHTFAARDREHARQVAQGPMKSYLLAAAGLVQQYAWAFPAFKRPAGATKPMDIDLASLSQDEVDGILEHAFHRYFEESGLFGTVEDCLARVEQLKSIGVGEVGCLIDYGIAADQVLEALYPLAEVVRRTNAGAEVAADDYSIAAQIRRHKVTHLQCTPSMARMLCLNDAARAALAKVPHVMIGGEALPGALAQDIAGLTGQPVQNMYGPTETTIWSTTGLTRGGSGVAELGLPIANTTLHVVDAQGAEVPPGGTGELLIGGDGVTRGYWRQPALTARRFIANPFGPGRLYRTGDLVRRRAGGGLGFLGRIDHQVKIRGHRIELGEIEAALAAQPGITQAVVTAREDREGDQRLVGYYTGTPGTDLRAALAQVLPAHMRPAALVPLAEFPLTPNKKIDRAALPAPIQPVAQASAPQMRARSDGTLAVLSQVWCDVLGLAQVSPSDNFFDLGGHSLLAVQAHRAFRDRLNLPGLSITDLFRFPVLGDLAHHLDRAGDSAARSAQTTTAPPPTQPALTASERTTAMARRRAMRQERTART
ncbi:MAG: LLM class flavin-dependent oxidoreductase [Rhodobacteraceae bacterium]|nr:MAG: LLM class flavin-dependent oxidoreductase [Paracoccaceae bacterium]